MQLGIVLDRRKIDHPWQDYDWEAVAVIPDAPETAEWSVIDEGDDFTRYHAGSLPLEIHRKDTEGYRYNLVNTPPVVYVLLREDDDDDDENVTGVGADIVPFLVTVCPFEAQAYLDGDEHLVEPVPMPEAVAMWLAAYIEQHHVDEPRYKRKNTRLDPDKVGFGQRRPQGGGDRGEP